MSEAIEQIQNGLSVAKTILGTRQVEDWLPILLFSGGMKPYELRLLRTKSVEFGGKKKTVIKKDCDTDLKDLL